jgi:hypothetical protein
MDFLVVASLRMTYLYYEIIRCCTRLVWQPVITMLKSRHEEFIRAFPNAGTVVEAQ